MFQSPNMNSIFLIKITALQNYKITIHDESLQFANMRLEIKRFDNYFIKLVKTSEIAQLAK